jgi:hypothetical protein
MSGLLEDAGVLTLLNFVAIILLEWFLAKPQP